MNLAIFLPGWIGDAVMATPAIRALRQRYPTAHLVGVVKPYVAGVFSAAPWFDEWLLTPDSWLRSVFETTSALHRRHIDLAVLFPNSFRTALIARLGRCRRRIGYARYSRRWLLTDALEPVRDDRGQLLPSPILDAYNLLAERAGTAAPGRRLELFTTPEEEAGADLVWQRAGFKPHHRVVCLNPGAAFGSAKYWPTEHFAELARTLVLKRDLRVLILGGPAERIVCRQITSLARHPAVVALADQVAPSRPGSLGLSVGLTKACVRRSDLLVTTDSGPRHFAAAFDRPVVTLFGPTHIAWTETYHPGARHLQLEVECGPCQRRVCPLDHRCMRLLDPNTVFNTVSDLLSTVSRAS
jgi:heptosyltransferase II